MKVGFNSINRFSVKVEFFGSITYGGFQGDAEIPNGFGFKMKVGFHHLINTEHQGQILVILPEKAGLKLLPIGKPIELINQRFTPKNVINGEVYIHLWADDIVVKDS